MPGVYPALFGTVGGMRLSRGVPLTGFAPNTLKRSEKRSSSVILCSVSLARALAAAARSRARVSATEPAAVPVVRPRVVVAKQAMNATHTAHAASVREL
jgi:hypothetical protein